MVMTSVFVGIVFPFDNFRRLSAPMRELPTMGLGGATEGDTLVESLTLLPHYRK